MSYDSSYRDSSWQKAVLVQVMAWHQTGDKPSPEPMLSNPLMCICICSPMNWHYFYLLQLAVPCDENEQHTAVLFCITCGTHLCIECSELTHSTRTLAKHRRVPLSEKPREIPRCDYHPMHLVEFVCTEEECQTAPLMCYICKDYGRHVKHKVS